MRVDVFEGAPGAAAVAEQVLQALRARGAHAALNGEAGAVVAGRVDALAQALRRHAPQAGELVALDGTDPAQLAEGVLAAWLAGATPCLGPRPDTDAPRLRIAGGTLHAQAGAAPVRIDAALVLVEPLVGAVAHPLATLGRLAPPPAARQALTIVADWRADAWLPLALRALLDGTADLSLLDETCAPAACGGAPLAAPLAWFEAHRDAHPDMAARTLLTWGAGNGAGGRCHAPGDHFVLGLVPPDERRARVHGRHRVCNEAGRVLPDNAWGLLALAGTLPQVADGLDTLASPVERTWLTEYRARRRADGSIEFDDARLDPWRHAGRRLAPRPVQRLLAACGLGEAALAAVGPGPARRLVAYVTDGGASVTEGLEAALPRWAAPLGVAVLPRLARDAAGAVDLAAVRALAPPDSRLLAEVERALGGAERTDGTAVRLRTRARAAVRPPLPLPPGFAPEGSRYPGTGPAVLTGAPLDVPAGNLVDRLLGAAATGRGLVLVDATGAERTLSYAGLLDAAARIAAYLRGEGVAPGAEVIVHYEQPGDLFAGIWACILLGALPVPLTPASPYDAPANPLWHLLGPDTMLTCRTVLTSRVHQPAVRAALERRGLAATLLAVEGGAGAAPLPPAAWTPGRDALMLLTSGSTGAPKGVVLPHRSLVALSRAVSGEFGFDAVETSLNWLAIDHVGGLVQHHMRDLCLANQQLHVDTGYVLADPTRMLDLIDRHRVTLLWMANFGFNLLNEHADKIAAGRWDLGCVKLWENGGEAVTHEGCQRFLAMLAPHGLAPDVIKPVFGMTETTSACIGAHSLRRGRQDNVHWLSDTTLDSPVARALPGAGSPFVDVGHPFPGTAVRVVDANGQVCRTGVAGRIEVTGQQLMTGYYRNDSANADTFTPDGWLRMGDCGFIADGSLVVTGREKDIVIVNGLNYSAHALENTVEGVAGVRTGCCAAIAVRKPEDITDSLVVFYSDGAGAAADPAAIEAALIAEHGLRPVALVTLDPQAWPRTAIGKIRRQRLASGFVAGEFADQIALQRDDSLGERPVVPDWHFTLAWEAAAPAASVAPPRRVLWLGGADTPAPAGAGLAASPGAPFAGFDAAGTARYRAGDPADLAALLAAADTRLGGLHVVVDAHWHTATAAPHARVAGEVLREACAQWEALCGAAERLPVPPALLLATRDAFAVDGSEASIGHAVLPGVAASLAQAHPRLGVTLVDGADAAEVLLEQGAAGYAQVAYRGGTRLAPTLHPVSPPAIPAAPALLRRGGRYLVIGGLGGVGAHLCQHLLRGFGARLMVVGRTPAEGHGLRAQVLAYLEGQAAQAGDAALRYLALDATDGAALAGAVRAAEQAWGGPLDAVFNLAGEGAIAERLSSLERGGDDAAALRRAQDRLALVHAVDEALEERATPVITFSSVNGWFGGTGFVEYAGACAYQAAYAAWRAGRGTRRHVCLDWSMWKQVGMAADVPAAMAVLARRRGFDSLTPGQGLASLHVALENGAPRQLIGLCAQADAVLRQLPPRLVDYEVEAAGVEDAAPVATALGIAPERVRCARAALPAAASVLADHAAHAATLLGVFRDVLVRPELGADDNFFANGGDSIRAIQVVSRAAEHGLVFSPLDLFEHKSVAALLGHLASHRRLADASPVEELDDGQPVTPPPIFGWWLDQPDQRALRNHFTMGMRYEVSAGLAPEQVHGALLALVERHEALRLRLCGTAGAWRLAAAPDAAGSLAFETHVLDGRDGDAERIAAIEQALHRGLDVEHGPLVGAAHLTLPGRPLALLVLTIHHAAVDGVSWRILEEDLRALLAVQRGDGRAPAPATIGFLDWSRRLARRARRVDGAALADAWAARLAQPVGRLPDVGAGPLLESDTAILSRVVPIDALRLLGDASVLEVLLAAVGWSLAAWMGSDALALDVEGHGRLSREMPEDLARTIGWFTTIAPLRLDFAGCRTPADALPRVRTAADGLRGHDLEWGLLHYLDACPPAHPLRAVPRRQVSFNYLGSFDSTAEPDALLAALPDSLSAEQAPGTPRRYVIDIAALVANRDLTLSVKYSPQVHGHAVIERWLDGYEDALRQLLNGSGHHALQAGDMQLALDEVQFDTDDA